MPRTLYVHVGPRKTATTSIQGFLSRHDNSVVVYPKVGLHPEGSHHNLIFKYFGEEHRCIGTTANGTMNSLFRKIAKVVSDSDRNVVISSEELASRDVGAFIGALLSYISHMPMDVEIVIACREHFARAASWYKMRLRVAMNGEQLYLPDQFLRARAPAICYAPLVQKMRSTGFRVTALNYQPSESWVERFLKHIGFAGSEIPAKIAMKQVGPGTKALIATIATNRVTRSKEERRRYLKAFAKMPGDRDPSGFIFGGDAAADAERLFREDRRFLWEEFGVQIDPPDIESQESKLFIDGDGLKDIVDIARNLGAPGEKIIELAQQFVRDGSRSET
jgi:hypothetical protein